MGLAGDRIPHQQTPAVLGYMDSLIGMFLAGGFSVDLTHHVMHAIGSRMWGFTQELFDDPAVPTADAPEALPPEAQAAMLGRWRPGIRTSRDRHGRRHEDGRSSGTAATTSSSSSSPSTCSSTASSGCTSRAGHRRRAKPGRT